MNIAETTTSTQTVAMYTRDAAPAGGSSAQAVESPVRTERTGTQPALAKTAGGTKATTRTDTFVASGIADQSAMYDVADIRRSGGGHVLPRYQITHRLTLEGDKRVEKLVDVILATERKSLRIYREQK